MERTIKIGAGEIILWLRKNNRAVGISNEGVDGLGRRIYDLIVVSLDGRKIDDSFPSLWDETDTNIKQWNLPSTSAQYEIKADKLPELYLEISKW